MDQEPQDNHSGAGEIDLNSILLPKKVAPSVDSAQRVDAGILLNQEQNATLAKVEPSRNSLAQRVVPDSAQENFAAASNTSAQVLTKFEGVRPLQTYQGDIAGVVRDEGVSVVSIAAAEATRRGNQPISEDRGLTAQNQSHTLRTITFVVIGVLLLCAAVGVLGVVVLRQAPVQTQPVGAAPYIAIDGTAPVTIPVGASGTTVMNALVQTKNSLTLSLGLVGQLYIQQAATSSDAQPTYMDAQALFSALAPSMPPTLLRDIEPVYLLGVHSFGINQPFLLLKVDSYEQAYAGMLEWENTMKQDLSPLFTYVPAPKIQPIQTVAPVASSTATSSDTVPFIQTGFIDTIIANHDARVLEDQYGSVYFLWTFLDRGTLVIATNADTLQEILRRLTQAPVTALPTK